MISIKSKVEEIPAQAEALVADNENVRLMIVKIEHQMYINHEQSAAYLMLQEEIMNGNFDAGSVELF